MKCKTFQANLDAYVDSELDVKTRKAMEEHAMRCDECAALLDGALRLATVCAELNEGLTVPKACQTAWREAVRDEIEGKTRARRARRRPARHSGVVRALAALAATLVLTLAIGSQIDMSGVRLASVSDGYPASKSAATSGAYSGNNASNAAFETGAGYTAGIGSVRLESDGSADDTVAADRAASTDAAKPVNVIVIRSANRTILSEAFDDDLLLIDDLVTEYGAYYESRMISSNGRRFLNAVVRVPSESLDRFLTALDVVGEIKTREDLAEDVTGEYVDITTRLDVLRAQLEQLNQMTESAQNVTELIEINQRAAEVTAEIESYEGRLKSIESRRSYASVSIQMSERQAEDPAQESATLMERMRAAFEDSIAWLKGFGQDVAVFGAALLPRLIVWVPVAVIVIILLKVVFGRKKKSRGK